jgi:hypothetical protein
VAVGRRGRCGEQPVGGDERRQPRAASNRTAQHARARKSDTATEGWRRRWRRSIDTWTDADGAELLEARLLRLPSVLTVDLDRSAALAVAG